MWFLLILDWDKMKKSLLILGLMLFSAGLFAKVIEGFVTDTKTGKPIHEVLVQGKYKKKSFRSETGKKGHFIFEYNGKYPFTIEFYHPNYKTKTIEVKNGDTEINIALEKSEEIDSVSGKIYDFSMVEFKPVFPGCENEPDEVTRFDCLNAGVMQVVIDNFNYPVKAQKKKIEGKVFVNFVISKTGDIKNVHVIKGAHKLLNEEAVRLIKLIPKMKPAIQRGEPVNISYTVPLNFKL